MTEFALVLPVFLLIVVVAIDFGRAFFGYITLTNATRIGANYAASHPTAWGTPGSAADRDEYNDLILADTNTANCELQLVGGEPPEPTFADGPDTSTPDSSTDVGDRVNVGLTCTFDPLTPIIGDIVGSSLSISANTDFAVRAGVILGVPIAPAVTPGPTPVPTPTPAPGATPTPTPTPAPSPTPCPFVTVPGVNGMTPTAANTAIGGAGLTPNGIGDLTTGPKNSATNQNPVAGACVPSGTTVTYHYRPS